MPAPLSSIEGIDYSLALIHPSSHAVLCSIGPDNARRLPHLWSPTNVRVTAHLRQAIQATWGLRGAVLDYLPSEVGGSRCVAVELFSADIPTGLRPFDVEQVWDDDLSPHQRSSLLCLLSGKAESPVTRIGWLQEAVCWVEETTREKISSIQEIEQLNAGGSFSLLRFPMRDGQSYWLKATGEPNQHELPVTTFLSKLCPDHIPEVLAVKPEWNAWLTRSQGTSPAFPSDEIKRQEALRLAVIAMAEIQLQSMEHHTELLLRGAFDQRWNVLRSNSHTLFEGIREAMSRQTSTKAAVIDNAQLHDLHQAFDAVCDFLVTLQIPPMVLHGDMNIGNVLYDDGRCQFVDWCETYVGHPFVTLQHLLLLNQPESARLKSSWDAELIGCYREVMKVVLDPDAFDRAMISAPLMAAASALYGRGDWLGSASSLAPRRQARIRTLARCMDRAAREPWDSGMPRQSRLASGGTS